MTPYSIRRAARSEALGLRQLVRRHVSTIAEVRDLIAVPERVRKAVWRTGLPTLAEAIEFRDIVGEEFEKVI